MAIMVEAGVRARVIDGAERLGIGGAELAGLVAVLDTGDCSATQARMADVVGVRLAAVAERSVALTEQAAAVQSAHAGNQAGTPAEVVDLHAGAVAGLAEVARLQAAAARLAEPSTAGACGGGCACVTAASARTAPRIPVARAALPLLDDAAGAGADLVCTLDGGLDAMRGRIGEWQAVIGRAVGREAVDGGVTLVYGHDPAVAVELARLAAAEFACCSFFSFVLAVEPAGMRFTVTAPAEAATLVTAVFGEV
ncbi:hypothetical protein ACIBSW_02655 [Actinoplanes sp. NPDC049668]|uniref:hypothetical protein n=1 Tax=unclassified Actinoplanes TaxID=2626549 RepID=UPI00339EA490